ncbi:MAG: hypothetical protein KA792_00760 [Bacteroidales bacterium]|nr:hypothetical protein [Bacteroidales bacterium]
MKQKYLSLCFFIFIQQLLSQGIIPEYRRTDWSKAGCEQTNPCPALIYNATDFAIIGDSLTDNSNALNSVFSKLNKPCVLFFPAGSYLFKRRVNLVSGVIIRGEGAKKTKFYFNQNGYSENSIYISKSNSGALVNVISGYQKASKILELENTNNFKVNGYLEIQQSNDSALMYTSTEWMNQDYSLNSVGQIAKITAINENFITIDRELRISYNPLMIPKCRPVNMIADVGIENLYIERLDSTETDLIYFNYATNSWIKNIETYKAFRTHIKIGHSCNIEVKDSYIHHAWAYGGGGQGYGVCIIYHSGDCLIENNIFVHLRHAMILATGANANVIAYNYSSEPFADFANPPDISLHGYYLYQNLFEGNIIAEVGISDHWGPAGPGNTFLRNRIYAYNLYIYDKTADQNIIGNEFTSGSNIVDTTKSTSYVTAQSSGTLMHGNNENGRIYWTPSITDHNIPASYYLNEKPAFFGRLPFPPMGPDRLLGKGTIPAYERFKAKKYIKDYDCSKLFNIAGYVVYANQKARALANVKVLLQDCSDMIVIDSVMTDSNGAFNFKNKAAGLYFIFAENNAKTGGINPIDALRINKHYLSIFKIKEYLKLKAADVNGDKIINPVDALLINKYFLNITKKFPVADWLSETKQIIIDNADNSAIIQIIATGDTDASFY